MAGEMKEKPAARNPPGGFLSFSLFGLIGFVAAVGFVVVPTTSVAAEIGDIAVPLVASVVGFVLSVGFMTAWLTWLMGPLVVKLGAVIIRTLRRAVTTATVPDSLTRERGNDGSSNTPVDSPRFRHRLRTSFWKAGRWAIVLSLLWGCGMAGAVGGLTRHRQLVVRTRVQADSLVDALANYNRLHGRYPLHLQELPGPVSDPRLGDGYIYRSFDPGEWFTLQYTVDPRTCFEWNSDTSRWTEIELMLLPVY
jgi:hypothetical protein